MEIITEAANNLAKEVVTTATSGWQIKIVNPNTGEESLISLSNISSVLANQTPLNGVLEGVFIMYHRLSDDFPLAVHPSKWPSLQSSGEIAEGVLVVEGGKSLVVAPDEESLFFSSAEFTGGGFTTTDRQAALDDWNGKSNTAALIAHAECNSVEYAAGYCAAYSRTNANGKGLTAGKWWLASLGQKMFIYANLKKINYALSFITGATLLSESWYWSSTEFSARSSWYLHFDNGSMSNNTRTTGQGRVRPVSAFIY